MTTSYGKYDSGWSNIVEEKLWECIRQSHVQIKSRDGHEYDMCHLLYVNFRPQKIFMISKKCEMIHIIVEMIFIGTFEETRIEFQR